MDTQDDPGMRWARRSGVVRQIDRAARALKAAAPERALAQLRLFPVLDGGRVSAPRATGSAVQTGASERDRRGPDALPHEAGVARPAGITGAGVAGVPGVKRGGGAGLESAGGQVAQAVAGRTTTGGGGWKLVMYPGPSQPGGAEPRRPAAAEARTPSVRRLTAPVGMAAAAAARSKATDGTSAETALVAANGVAPVRRLAAATVAGEADAATRNPLQVGRRPAVHVGRLVTQSRPALAPAAAMSRAPIGRDTGRQAPVAPAARRAISDAGSVAVPPAGADPDDGVSAPSGRGSLAATVRADDGGSATASNAVAGDVYLDGTLMGRWIARSLAAEAARPASGSAAFDPRRNAFPTGAMIGG